MTKTVRTHARWATRSRRTRSMPRAMALTLLSDDRLTHVTRLPASSPPGQSPESMSPDTPGWLGPRRGA